MENYIFSKKELYALSHNKYGHNYAYDKISESVQRKLFQNNMHLSVFLDYSPSNYLPIVKPYNGEIDFQWISFLDRKKAKGENQGVHFFIDDYRFVHSVWDRLEKTSFDLLKFDYLVAPDFSLWVDLPPFYNLQSIFYNRFITSYWQNVAGFNVIPTASWGNVDSFSYCFSGLPEHSVIAVCGVGHKFCNAAKRLWQLGLQELEKQLKPTCILIYGEEEDVSFLHTPVKFIECLISKKLRG